MYLSTQPYIDKVEGALVQRRRRACQRNMVYPAYFTPEVAELFGYIIQVGTPTMATKECNFADCHTYPIMIQRIKDCYASQWNPKGLRINAYGYPRICGKKNLVFILAVCGSLQTLRPGHEKTPAFVYDSYDQCEAAYGKDVVKAYLKGLLGSAPKFRQLLDFSNKKAYNGLRIFFRSGQLYRETVSLLRYVMELKFKDEHGTLLFNDSELQQFKTTLDLTDPAWWEYESRWCEGER